MAANTDILSEQAARLEQLLPRLMRRLFPTDSDHAAEELPLAQLRVCSVLQHGPRSMSGLSDELGISVSAVTQLADRLEQAGMVERVPEPDDRRVRRLQLTTRGAETMQGRRRRRIGRVREAMATMSEEEREQAIHLVEALARGAEATLPHQEWASRAR